MTRNSGRARSYSDPAVPSLFSRAFGIDDPDTARWFDPVLTTDNPVFVDPFLLDLSGEPEFEGASLEVFAHFELLYQAVAKDARDERVEELLRFPEVPETCLGYTQLSTSGSGSGGGRAREMREAIGNAIRAGLRSPDHFEEIALLAKRIGRDLISDITTRILMHRFIAYTERVVGELGLPTHPVEIWGYASDGENVRKQTYITNIPRNPHTRLRIGILLVPKRLLRERPTINRLGFGAYVTERHGDEVSATFEAALRGQVKSSVLAIARENPTWVRDYTVWQMERGGEPYSFEMDPLAVGPSYRAFYEAGYEAGRAIPPSAPQPRTPDEMMEFVRFLAQNFKRHIEDSDGFRDCYTDPDECRLPKPESGIQRLFAGMSKGSCEMAHVRMARESEGGTGSVDFLFTSGFEASALLEAKLVNNSRYWNGVSAQLPSYMKAHDVWRGVFLGVAFNQKEVDSEQYVALHQFVRDVGKATGAALEAERVDARPRLVPASKLKGSVVPPKKRKPKKSDTA
jgi:hypothetical protein